MAHAPLAAVIAVALAAAGEAAAHAQPRRTQPPPAAAAPLDVGRLDEVKRLGELQGCDSVFPLPGAERVLIRRGGAGPVSAMRGETVRVDDALFVSATTDVKLRVESPELGRGTFYLAPSLLCNSKVGRDTVVRRLGRSTRGAGYALATGPQTRPAPPRGAARPPAVPQLELAVDSGALIVDWNGGTAHPLVIRVAGHRIPVLGTELAVHADRAGQEALLYLQEGTVTFEQFPTVTVRPGELYWLRRGFPPQLLGGGALLRPAVQRHARSVWQRFWQKPSFYAWTGLAAGAAAACVAACPFGSDTRADVSGTVIVRLPF